jgi:hypothetical protein
VVWHQKSIYCGGGAHTTMTSHLLLPLAGLMKRRLLVRGKRGGNAEGHAKPGSCLLCCIKSTLSAAFRSHTLSLCPALATCNAICPLLSRRNHSHSFWRLTKDRFALNCPAVLPRQILSRRYPHPSIAGFKRHNAQGQCVLIHLPCKHARNLVQCCSKMWTHSLRKNHT